MAPRGLLRAMSAFWFGAAVIASVVVLGGALLTLLWHKVTPTSGPPTR